MRCYRSQLLAIYEQVMDGVSSDRRRNLDGQISLFEMAGSSIEPEGDSLPQIKEFEKKYLLTMEKEMTGLYLSGHPLSEYSAELERYTSINTSKIMEDVPGDEEEMSQNGGELDNKIVTMGGIISSVRIKATRNNSMMAFIVIEDMYGSIEVLVFPKVYERFNKLVREDNMVLIKGRLSIREDEAPKLLAEDIKQLKKTEKNKDDVEKKLYLKVSSRRYNQVVSALRPILSAWQGQTPVYICLDGSTGGKKDIRLANRELWVDIDDELLKKLHELLGEESVRVC